MRAPAGIMWVSRADGQQALPGVRRALPVRIFALNAFQPASASPKQAPLATPFVLPPRGVRIQARRLLFSSRVSCADKRH